MSHSTTHSPPPPPTDPPTFEELLASSTLPPPGPSYYHARRTLWLTYRSPQPRSVEPSTGRKRLEGLLSRPGAVGDEAVWKNGIEKVWKGLSTGGRLKKRLPLNLVIKIIHAAWLRDPDTWPPGQVAPESDHVPDQTTLPLSSRLVETETSSTVSTPRTAAAFFPDPLGVEGSWRISPLIE